MLAQHECTAFRFDNAIDEYVCIECGAVADDAFTEPDDYSDRGSVCPECDGTGLGWDDFGWCDYCDGEGYKWWE